MAARARRVNGEREVQPVPGGLGVAGRARARAAAGRATGVRREGM
jgi:hypothetical protein